MTDDELMDRLRAIARQRQQQPMEPFRIPLETHSEWIAADRIASLKAENEKLSAALANQYSASANLMVHHEALFQAWSDKASLETVARIEHAREVLLKASLATKELLGEERARVALSPTEEKAS